MTKREAKYGRVVACKAFERKSDADAVAAGYRAPRGTYQARTYARWVRADGEKLVLYVVVIRERPMPEPNESLSYVRNAGTCVGGEDE